MTAARPEAHDDRRDGYRYVRGEERPVEILVFQVDPEDVDDFVRIDHEVWTLGEAFVDGIDHIPFVSKEVWLDRTRPGEVTLVFVWESAEAWDQVGGEALQRALQARFDERFGRPARLVRAPHEESDHGIVRWSRFERLDDP